MQYKIKVAVILQYEHTSPGYPRMTNIPNNAKQKKKLTQIWKNGHGVW